MLSVDHASSIGQLFVYCRDMYVSAIKTPRLAPGDLSLHEVLEQTLPQLAEGSIVAITSKIVSICEGSVVPRSQADKEELLVRESSLYLPASLSKYGHHFTITDNTLIPMAGIDESNGQDYYVLWPRDSQRSANEARHFLQQKYGLAKVGVIITDSTSQPLRRGTTGIALAHSGFAALRDYNGMPDLFERPFNVTQANVSGGLAAAAVFAMGEGAEQTPVCVISDVPSVEFRDGDPTAAELAETTIALEDDLFAPFLTAVEWREGERA
jgi:putative folate metabolism gamma-glutamate ligase